MALDEYNKKRRFKNTPEPEGKTKHAKKSKAAPLHFVVQKHHASHLHYDFRLEMDGVLKSWAVPKGPSMDPNVKRLAMMVEDHPISYMKFEGTIPKGNYGAGEVIVWDYGLYHSMETNNINENEQKLKHGLYKGDLKIVLYGEKLKGAFVLAKIKNDEKSWLLIKKKDTYATPESSGIITEQDESVLTGKNLPVDKETKRIKKTKKKDPVPHDIKPMLATLTSKPFDRPGWIFEIKWDGYRAIAEVDKEVLLYSRNNISFKSKYPTVVESLKRIKRSVVLDGEIVALDKNGKSNFHALQYYMESPVPLTYVVFDILYLDGTDLREKTLYERKHILKKFLEEEQIPGIMYGDYIEEKGVTFFEQAKKLKLEGIIAKDGSSEYKTGFRSSSWLKIKTESRQEAIIVGFTEPRGSRKKFGSLVLAVRNGGKLTYIGHSGGGFSDEGLRDLYARMLPLITETSPLKEKVPINSPITWVKPKLVCEIKFTEWTKDGRMRHPIFVGLREDKSEREVVKEVKEKEIQFTNTRKEKLKYTNLDKVYWPHEGYTKGDVINYYEKVSDIILPYLKDRPESLHRHPHGINGQSFFQKNIEIEVPNFVDTKRIWSESNEAVINYLVCNNKETLLYLANLGCIELNPWNSKVGHEDYPDYMIIDLDPGNTSFKDLIKVAQKMKDVLDIACQKSYVKTSGKRGMHILVPTGAKYTYEQVRSFSELIVRVVNRELSDITSVERNPSKRKDKIYLDYLQNRRGQTLAAPYSLRPWKGATVSAPLHWDEVTNKLDPGKFTIKTIFKRLDKIGDIWKPILTQSINLAESIGCIEKYLGQEKKRGKR